MLHRILFLNTLLSNCCIFNVWLRLDYYLYSFFTVDDVSAQTSCVISPDLDMLTTRSPLGRDVELHCQCMDDNGIITGTRWFSDMTTIVPTDSSSRPYSTGTAPSRLIFTSPFTNSDTGIYTCSPDSTFPTIPPGDSITLNAAGKYVHIYCVADSYKYLPGINYTCMCFCDWGQSLCYIPTFTFDHYT